MKNNYLILMGNNELEKVPGVNFLFPLQDFCVGLTKEYQLENIPNDSYLYLNRLLESNEIAVLKSLLPEIEERMKGIVFEDLGVLHLFQNSHLEKIFFAPHAVCSSQTAQAYLKEVNTLILSPDITEEEIRKITCKVKNLSLYLYGNLSYMYSRRTLLTNYQKEFQLPKENKIIIKEPIKKHNFLVVENAYGTVLYDPLPLDARCLMDLTDISYFFLNLEYTSISSLSLWLKDFENQKPLEHTTKGFLNQATIYRLPPKDGDNK